MSQRSVRPVQGALLLALSALLFACMGVVIREASATVNNENIVFFRNLVGVAFFYLCCWLRVCAHLKPSG